MSSFNTIKVEFASQLRRLAFDSSSSSWSSVRAQILNSYSIPEQTAPQFAFHYLDEEGDLINVNSDTEFAEAIRCAAQKKKILKFILSKSERPAMPPLNNGSHGSITNGSAVVDEVKEPLLKLAVDGHSDEAEIDVESVDDVTDQQEEEMDLPLDRRDLLSRSPTLSDASDSSFVSINAQSLRDDLDNKEDEHVAKTAEDSEAVKVVAVDDDGKASAPVASISAVSTPKQPEFIATDRAVVHDVMKQLAEDIIELKAATPKAVPNNPSPQVNNNLHSDKALEECKQANTVCAPDISVPVMKVKDLRSVVEGVINEKFLAWIDDLLSAIDNLDHAEEDMKRVHQLTTHLRLGLVSIADNRQYMQRISDSVAKKMMRIMKQAEGKQCKPKKQKQQTKDEEEKQAGPKTPILEIPTPTSVNTNSSSNTIPATLTPSVQAGAATSASASSSSSCVAAVAPVIHHGIICDGCGLSPIRGVRFHCLTCDQIDSVRNAGGFDLCEACEGKGMHQQVDGKAHVLLKFKQPTKFIVDVEVPAGPIVGQQVYDVLRVNEDGSRTPFTAPQTVIATPAPKPTTPAAAFKDEKKEEVNVSAVSKVNELENRIRALETIIKVDAEKKVEKRAEKQRLRKEKEERKKLKEEAAAKVKAAKAEAKQKLKETKAAAKAAAAAKKEEAKKAAQLVKAKKEQNDEKIEQKEQGKKEANVLSVADNTTNEQPKQQSSNEQASSAVHSSAIASTVAPPAMNASTSNAPTSSSAAPFAFTLPQFPFSDMVNSITSTVSNTLATTPFSFNNPNANTKPSAPSQQEANAQTANSAASSSSAPTLSASSSSNAVGATSTWSLAGVSGSGPKPSLASVRAPAFFPYMQQLRDLESMGFDVDKSIHALRFYRGDMQKAINSML